MAKVMFGNHSAVVVPRVEQARIRAFYCGVLGCTLTREREGADDIRMGDVFHMGFLYSDDADESEFLRSGKSVWLEIKSDNVEEMTRKILDVSRYEGSGEGPNVGKIKEVLGSQTPDQALSAAATQSATP